MEPKRAVIWCAVSTQPQAHEDKESLPEQEKQARALCEERGWQIIDVLRVPGHSRNYFDFNKLKEAAYRSRLKIDAFLKIENHWESRDFDVLIVRDGDRFARTQALHAYFTERTILEAKGIIWSFADGEINQINYSGWTALSGYKASNENRERAKKFQIGMDGLAKRGLPTSPRPPFTHRLIREPKTGRAEKLVVDESKRPLFDAIMRLILEGVSFRSLEEELFKLGFTNDDGKPFHQNWGYRLLFNPPTWGNLARHYSKAQGGKPYRGGWVWDPSCTPPENAKIFYDVIPPVYTGEIARRLQAELLRRVEVIKGRTRPGNTKMFSGLLVCADCRYVMVYQTFNQSNYRCLFCKNARRKRINQPPCNNTGYINEKEVKAEIDSLLRKVATVGRINPQIMHEIFEGVLPEENLADTCDTLRRNIEAAENRARVLIREQIAAPEGLQHIYRDELKSLNDAIERDKQRLVALEQEQKAQASQLEQQQLALDEITNSDVDRFWEKSSTEINQLLHQLMGNRRFVVHKRKIIRTRDRIPRGKRP